MPSHHFDEQYITDITYDDGDRYSGIVIVTDKQHMNFKISNYTSCCEDYGITVLINERERVINDSKDIDDFKDDLIGQKVLCVKHYHDGVRDFRDAGDEANFEIKTTDKEIIISLWNEHNGYYPHDYVVNWNDYTDSGTL